MQEDLQQYYFEVYVSFFIAVLLTVDEVGDAHPTHFRRLLFALAVRAPLCQQGWNDIMGDVADVRCVLFLHCPEDVLEERLLSRGKSSGRTDDNAETAKRRFRTYVETTLPVSPSFCALSLGIATVTAFLVRRGRGTACIYDEGAFVLVAICIFSCFQNTIFGVVSRCRPPLIPLPGIDFLLLIKRWLSCTSDRVWWLV